MQHMMILKCVTVNKRFKNVKISEKKIYDCKTSVKTFMAVKFL